jgi:hypothetical protein
MQVSIQTNLPGPCTLSESGFSEGEPLIQGKRKERVAEPGSGEGTNPLYAGSLVGGKERWSIKSKPASSSKASDPGRGSTVDAAAIVATLVQGRAATLSKLVAGVSDRVGQGSETSCTASFSGSTIWRKNGDHMRRNQRSASYRRGARLGIRQGRDVIAPKAMAKEFVLKSPLSETTSATTSQKVSVFV